jgi:hypothetical protein
MHACVGDRLAALSFQSLLSEVVSGWCFCKMLLPFSLWKLACSRFGLRFLWWPDGTEVWHSELWSFARVGGQKRTDLGVLVHEMELFLTSFLQSATLHNKSRQGATLLPFPSRKLPFF